MTPRLLLFALLGALALLASVPAAATGEPVLQTASIDAALLPPDPDVVTDADLANVGAQPAVQQLNDDPNQLVVDDDLAQCPSAEFTTAAGIQLAIEAAPPGEKIRVCPGNYSPINVHKADLWLQAPRTHGGATQCHEGDPAQDAIIAGTNASGLVQIAASGVRFEGFTVQGNLAGPGVRTDSSGSGYELSFNEIRLNQYGVDLNTDGVDATAIDHNCIRDNQALGGGVLTSSGYSNAVFEHNFFTGHMCASISNLTPTSGCFETTPVQNVTVAHNSFIEDTTVAFGGGTNVTVEANEWVDHFGAAVILNNVVNGDVSSNHVDGAGAASQGFFVSADSSTALNIVVRNNKLENLLGGFSGTFQFFGSGIVVRGLGVTVLQNWIQSNRGSGIFLGPQSDGNSVHGNLLVGNGFAGLDALPRNASDGIRVEAGAVGNTIENNRLRENVDHDCHDNNPNGANTWRHNVGYTENQPGLCFRPA